MYKSSQLVFFLLFTLATAIAALPLEDGGYLTAREPSSQVGASDLVVRKAKSKKKKAGKILKKVGGAALDIAGSVVPGVSAAKGLFKTIKGLFKRDSFWSEPNSLFEARELGDILATRGKESYGAGETFRYAITDSDSRYQAHSYNELD